MKKTFKITTPDGVKLNASYYGSGKGNPCLIINSALGASQYLYHPFADYLSNRGFSVLTYDYRGMGDDKNHDIGIDQWGEMDQSSVIACAKKSLEANKIIVLGNSIGGQLLGMATNLKEVDGVVLVASQSGDWRNWKGVNKIKMLLLWYALIPLLAMGKRFPANKLGLGDSKWPARPIRQWACWGRSKGYLFNAKFNFPIENWHNLEKPLLSFGFTDDHLAPETAIQALLAEYKKADKQHHQIKPQEMKHNFIGHFGFFKDKCVPLWDRVIDWSKDL